MKQQQQMKTPGKTGSGKMGAFIPNYSKGLNTLKAGCPLATAPFHE
jgi:hypothetical protein